MAYQFTQTGQELQYLLNEAMQLAEEYDSSVSYAVGDYCSHEGTLYRCTTATTGTWDASKWTSNVIVLNALRTLKGRMDTAEGDIDQCESDISALNQSLTQLIKRTSFSGTPSAAGNFSHAFGRNVFVLAAAASVADTVAIPYPSSAGYSTWWFNCHAAGVSFPPYTSGSLTVTVAYIEI